ncbi:MAG: DUF4837 family protein [Paludibacter sp.]|jgi:hypothetical protein|nr:DUF4837 family protein [Paludibacter sp.]
MLKKIVLPLIVLAMLLNSCVNSGPVLPSATGSRFEILIVMDDAAWKAPSGRAVVALFNQDMLNLPQAEPVMDISQLNNSEFSDLVKPTRNILVVDINPRFEQPKIIFGKNTWSQPQSLVKIQAANDSVMEQLVKNDGERILTYFLESERERGILLGKNYLNKKVMNDVEKQFGIRIDIPTELSKTQKAADFYWITNDHARIRKDLIIYSYPYTDKKMLTREWLIAARDSVLKANVPGELEGSYMGTELKYHQPFFRAININDTYCAELAGLWRMYNGGSMGGPFYSHTRVDEVNKKVITVEGLVFAPGVNKRNHIRQMEAIVYTTRLPQEINALQEVSVVADTNQQ